jgi:hypothetical protein
LSGRSSTRHQPDGRGGTMKPCEAMTVNNRLANDVTMACVAALKAGLDKADVLALLARIQELLENSEE